MLHGWRFIFGRDDPVRSHERRGGDPGWDQGVLVRPEGRGDPAVRAQRPRGRRRQAERADADGRVGRREGSCCGLPHAERGRGHGGGGSGGERGGGRGDVQGGARAGSGGRYTSELDRALPGAQGSGGVSGDAGGGPLAAL